MAQERETRLPTRQHSVSRRAAALAAVLVVGCASGEPVERPDEVPAVASWHVCSVASDCTWTVGEGGWPAAVNAERESDYLAWVESQAPFTTYFTPDDCFLEGEELSAYVSESRSSVDCRAGSCTLTVSPHCTR